MDCNCKYIAVKTNKSQKVTITKKKKLSHFHFSAEKTKCVQLLYPGRPGRPFVPLNPRGPLGPGSLLIFITWSKETLYNVYFLYVHLLWEFNTYKSLFFMIIFMTFCKAASKCLYINTMSQPVAVSVCVLIANNVVSRNVLFSWTNFSP